MSKGALPKFLGVLTIIKDFLIYEAETSTQVKQHIKGKVITHWSIKQFHLQYFLNNKYVIYNCNLIKTLTQGVNS